MKRLLWLVLLVAVAGSSALPLLAHADAAGVPNAVVGTKAKKHKRHRRHHKNHHKGHLTRDRYPQG